MDAEAIGRIHVETWQATYAGMLEPGYLARLDTGVRRLVNPHVYHVSITERLHQLRVDLIARTDPD